MAKIRLINTRHQPFLAVEYHDIVCRRRNRCDCQTSQRMNEKNKAVIKRHCASFHVPAMGKSKELDREVLHLQSVWNAVKSGWLAVKELEAPEALPVIEEPKEAKKKASKPTKSA